jgi:shikimate kinase
MKGTATARAAITIVNALPTGMGCALGIELPVTACVTLERTVGSAPPEIVVEPPADTPLVREAVRDALALTDSRSIWVARVRVDSEIPWARGLKSSSAVASAVAAATLRALDRKLPPIELARLAAGTGRRVGLSATGAFDDALAGLTSGFVLTDNRTDLLLRSVPVDPTLRVVLLIPPAEHRPSPEWREAFERRAAESRLALEDAANGHWASAIELNTALVEEVMGYDYVALRHQLRDRGAAACGVSGLGPTLAALVDQDHADSVLEGLREELGDRKLVAVATVGLVPALGVS